MATDATTAGNLKATITALQWQNCKVLLRHMKYGEADKSRQVIFYAIQKEGVRYQVLPIDQTNKIAHHAANLVKAACTGKKYSAKHIEIVYRGRWVEMEDGCI